MLGSNRDHEITKTICNNTDKLDQLLILTHYDAFWKEANIIRPFNIFFVDR